MQQSSIWNGEHRSSSITLDSSGRGGFKRAWAVWQLVRRIRLWHRGSIDWGGL